MPTIISDLASRLRRIRARMNGEWIDGGPDLSWNGDIYSRSACIARVAAAIGARRYLEIGCDSNVVFKGVPCDHKVGVDPSRGGTVRATSDDFFAANSETFDLVFIDGLHECAQVVRDIDNSLAALSANGAILMHDCLPLSFKAQAVPPMGSNRSAWNGDVWKAVVWLKQRADVDTRVLTLDHGVALLLPRANTDRKDFGVEDCAGLDYRFYLEHYRDFGLIGYDDIDAFVAGSHIPA